MVKVSLGVGKWSRFKFWIKIYVDAGTHLTQQNQEVLVKCIIERTFLEDITARWSKKTNKQKFTNHRCRMLDW